MQYMVLERFKNGDPVPVYRRFRAQGRLAPDRWIAAWADLVDFEVVPVVRSAEAAARLP